MLSRYIEPIQEEFVKKIENGLLDQSFRLESMTQAGEVRGKVFDVLLDVVVLHAQIQDICPSLLSFLMRRITLSLFLALLCGLEKPVFISQKVGNLSLGGYVQLMTEIAFMEHTLKQYLSAVEIPGSDAAAKISEIKSKLSNLSADHYKDIPPAGKAQFRQGLENARKATENQFLCFSEESQ